MQIEKHKKITTIFFLFIFSCQLLAPTFTYALTNGPSQPEMQKFEPAGATDLVDLFSGDMKYNIPLMDIGGYPVNLSYQSGTGIDDEASWVGTGWTVNPGAVNRNMRGLPDDFDGRAQNPDKVQKEYSRKPFQKIGATLILKPSILSWEFGKASLKVNVYKDNRYGIGASVGASMDFNIAKNSKSSLTAGLGITSDARDGLDIDPNLAVSVQRDNASELNTSGLSGSLHYNTRTGLKSFQLGTSFSSQALEKLEKSSDPASLSFVHYFGQSYTPSITNNTSNFSFSFGLDGGVSLFGGYLGIGGTGYVYREKIKDKNVSVPAFGYMNHLKGQGDINALLDFNREKDGVFIQSTPAIGIPVATQDYFVATGQMGSQQFRPFYSGNLVVFDKEHHTVTNKADAGITAGGGNIFKGGARISFTHSKNQTQKWIHNNGYLDRGEYKQDPTKLDEEPVYFKAVGEPTEVDHSFFTSIKDDKTTQVLINTRSNATTDARAYATFKTREETQGIGAVIKKLNREKRVSNFSYLTVAQAKKYGLDKTISGQAGSSYRKDHHISEITVTDNEGKRSVYGIPVYNTYQEEVTFSVNQPADFETARRKGLIQYGGNDATPDNSKGRDNLYSKEIMDPYATSYLLTGILSSDYVDIKDDGITDDDLGTAVKFNYTKLGQEYRWRAPYAENMANYNEGYISDKKDDKASYTYGKKEVWYLQAIESKTMIAVFSTSNRDDGLGVLGNTGGKDMDAGRRLQKLDKITLYSKADWVKDPANAIPVKTVHFEYDYSLYPGVLNNVNQGQGKLTLKKVYFTFGKNNRGQSNPYEFFYDMRAIETLSGLPAIPLSDEEKPDAYLERQSDRWGTYKKSWYNQQNGGSRVMNNSEFPYSLQENEAYGYNARTLADRFASKWQLNKIITPSNGEITIEYESDDYAYVQNRRAMQMCSVTGINTEGNQNNLISSSSKLLVELPRAVGDIYEFQKLYMTEADGKLINTLFYKIYADLDNRGHYEYINGYGEVDWDHSIISPTDNKKVIIALKPLNGYNPIAKAGWQMVRTSLPQYAYDGYDNSDADSFGDDFMAAIRSLIQASKNMVTEITTPFDKRASNRHFSDNIKVSKSMVRLCNPYSKKLGGGSRVRKVQISDQWNSMTEGTSTNTAKYGQTYEYTTQDNNGKEISSGVASYEPQIGNEENPFHEPVNFTEKVHWSADNYHFIEKPFCESYFPAASVGYSRVTVTSFGDDYVGSGPVTNKRTGYIVNEFYTAKDFPTLVDNMPVDFKDAKNSVILSLFASVSIRHAGASQGFKIELNDMHGKPRTVKVYKKGGALVSSTEYFYNEKDPKAPFRELNNKVPVLRLDGSIENNVETSTDIDFVTDVRDSNDESFGVSIAAYPGSMIIPVPPPAGPWYIPYGSFKANPSVDISSYSSICAVKVIHRFGIVKKVVTTQDGSTIEAENLVWDGLTGQVLLTKTENEFGKASYAFSYPAYMVKEYEGMDMASKNLGIVFSDFTTDADGKISSTTIQTYLFPGDEMIQVGGEQRGWIIKSPLDNTLRLTDEKGDFISTSGSWKIVRSGRRNMLSASAGSVVTMNDPWDKTTNRIVLSIDQHVLDAKAIEYKEEWGMPVSNEESPIADDCSALDVGCLRQFLISAVSTSLQNGGTQNVRRGIYSANTDNQSAATFIGNFDPGGYCLGAFALGQPASAFSYYLNTIRTTQQGGNTDYYIAEGDEGHIGGYKITFTHVDPEFTTISNSTATDATQYDMLFNGTADVNVSRYCLFKTGDCSYSFRKAECYPARLATRTSTASRENAGGCITSANCDYTDLLNFTLENETPTAFECLDPVGRRINPYFNDILGNWRPLKNYVYTVAREQKPGSPAQNGGTDIRNSGYYTAYAPFWNWNAGVLQRTFTSPNQLPLSNPLSRWVWSNKSVYYDQKGNEIENMDALGRYGAALWGYRQSIATAVGANGRHNEIAFDGFEDYDFSLQSNLSENCPPKRHFDWNLINQSGQWVNQGAPGNLLTTQQSHTGKYSYKLTSAVTITKAAGNAEAPSQSVLSYDAAGRYKLEANEQALGFAPVSGKKYILSLWVNDTDDDNAPDHNTIQGLQVKINNVDLGVSSKIVPVVEGWKRLELTFVAGSQFKLELIPSGTIYIDDVRLFPNDGNMASYVYDSRTLRLMAQLDENNFATLYEYDDEGTPVRVKKETEKGILTIKESRQSLSQRP
jgi:hypothetical protein